MDSQTKSNLTCTQCGSIYSFGSDEVGFFERFNLTPPDVCNACALERLMTLRNDRALYKRECVLCGKSNLSMYSPTGPYVSYCHECWWNNKWDPFAYGTLYNPERPLFEQFKTLQLKVPREGLIVLNSPSSAYSNNVRNSKNIYFSFQVANAENVYNSIWVVSRDCVNSHKIFNSEKVAYSFDVSRCYNCAYLLESSDCSDCYFSRDLKGCNKCLFSNNLRNASYRIKNVQVSKKEYQKVESEILNGRYSDFLKWEKDLVDVSRKSLHKYQTSIKTTESSGNYLEECNLSSWCFFGFTSEHIHTISNVLNAKDAYYSYALGPEPSQFIYATATLKGGSNCFSCYNLTNSTDCYLSDSLISCSNCIACVGLNKQSYCILNQKYSPEDYQKLKQRLLSAGELTGFIPSAFSTFAYNETSAFDAFPMSKEEAVNKGYLWRDDIPFTKGQETKLPEDLPDSILDFSPELLREIFRCVRCERNYRLIAEEIEFYRSLRLPVPRICPQCRIADQINKRTPLRLWHRTCMCGSTPPAKSGLDIRYKNTAQHFHGGNPCPNEFETSHAPDRPEMVYCEACYNSEVA